MLNVVPTSHKNIIIISGNAKTDTLMSEVEKATYVPTTKTFEEDIMDIMGIKEDRKPPKTYWY